MKRGAENDNGANVESNKKIKKPTVAFKGMKFNFTEAAATQHFEGVAPHLGPRARPARHIGAGCRARPS